MSPLGSGGRSIQNLDLGPERERLWRLCLRAGGMDSYSASDSL
jgi:hypothetical protein